MFQAQLPRRGIGSKADSFLSRVLGQEIVKMMKAIDPVCGMEVEISTALWKTELGNTTQYFCSPVCKRTFDENIDKVLDLESRQRSSPDKEIHNGV